MQTNMLSKKEIISYMKSKYKMDKEDMKRLRKVMMNYAEN